MPRVNEGYVTTPSTGAASHVTTPSTGAASHVTTPFTGAASHVTTPSAGAASHVTTPSADAASHVTTPSAGAASHVTTPSAGDASHVTTPSAGAASKVNDQEIKILSRETCLYNWTHSGITMEVPSGCLPEDVAECRLKVAASLGTDILLPEDTTLVSAVYHIITPPNVKRLKKPVTIHIQHCAGLKPGEEDKLSFVVAKEGATKFEFLPGGHFSSAHGSITLHSFSLLAIVSDMLYGSTYCGCIYYTNIEPDGSHEVHIVVIKKLSLAFQIVSEEYQVKMHHQKLLKFETNQIVLKLSDCSPDGWKLIPILLEVDKDEVDYFVKGPPPPALPLVNNGKLLVSN
eukprot:Em0017g547a